MTSYIKNHIRSRSCYLLIFLVLAGVSCTKDFKSINTNSSAIGTIDQASLPFLFSHSEYQGVYSSYDYQIAQNLFADIYAQYFALVATYFNSDRYNLRMDWLIAHWRNIYSAALPSLQTVLDNTDTLSAEHAVCEIWRVFMFHRLTDYYGPIPYFNAGNSDLNSFPYDSQEDIYHDFFKRLDEAIQVLKQNTSATPFGTYDLIYSGNVNRWIKFANTLRLRLALRISKAEPDLAKTQAEAAVQSGPLLDIADDAFLSHSGKNLDYNPLSLIPQWNEFRMSATIKSFMAGYDDPRMEIYFQPATGTGLFAGVRNGLSAAQQTIEQNLPANNSNVGTRFITYNSGVWTGIYTNSQDVMHSAETYFLMAEGAMNGWNMGGTAKDFYEQGIRTSMAQWGVTDQAVINNYINNPNLPVAPGDQQNSPAVAGIPVMWGATEAVQREQIGTQKWLALYPDGFEAWAEVRRSGFPKQYPVVNSENADLPVGTFIRRIVFQDVEKQTNAAAVDAAVSLLGGPDKASTPLWWDKN
jgi:hypothetical protein